LWPRVRLAPNDLPLYTLRPGGQAIDGDGDGDEKEEKEEEKMRRESGGREHVLLFDRQTEEENVVEGGKRAGDLPALCTSSNVESAR